MSTTNDTTDDSRTDDEQTPDWSVSQDGVTLEKIGYEEYRLAHGAFDVHFRRIRHLDDEEGYELLGRRSHTLGVFRPDDDDVPDRIAVAFRVLAHEN